MISLRLLLLAATLVAVPFVVSAQPGGVTVENPFARPSAGVAGAGAAYMTIRGGAGSDRLVAGSAEAVAGKVELHTHVKDGDVMRMRKIEFIEVPAQGMAEMKPGGLHLMLMNLKGPLRTGDSFDLTLVFEKAGPVTVKVPVRGMGAGTPHGQTKHGMPKH